MKSSVIRWLVYFFSRKVRTHDQQTISMSAWTHPAPHAAATNRAKPSRHDYATTTLTENFT